MSEQCGTGAIPRPDSAPVIATLQALLLDGVPWRDGGKTPVGFDCYGLVHYAFSLGGIALPETPEEARGAFEIIPPPYHAWDVLLARVAPYGERHIGLLLTPGWGYHCSRASNGLARFVTARGYWRQYLRHGLRYKPFLG